MKKIIKSIFSSLLLGVIAIIAFLLILYYGIFFLDEYHIKTSGRVQSHDPCYGKYYYAKGPVYEVREDQVCLEFHRGATSVYIKTLENADPRTFQKIGHGYYKDKNNVYYGHKITGADPNTFKHQNNVFSDKNGIWEKGMLIL